MKIIFCVLLAFICTAAIPVSAQMDSIFKIPYPKRYEAIFFFVSSSNDSATDIRQARALLEYARKNRDERDILCAERAVLAEEQRWAIDLSHIEQKGKSIIVRANAINCHPIRAFVYTILGNYHYENTHNYVLAFQYYLQAYNEYHDLYKSEFPDMSRTQYPLAMAYYKFNDYSNSLKYSKDLLNNDLRNSPWLEILINNLVGMSYLKLQRYDSAKLYFQKTLELAPSHHNPKDAIAWQGIATGNIGIAWSQQNEYDKAIPYLIKGEEKSAEGGVPDNVASFSIYLADIYMQRKNMAEAEKQLQIARSATYAANELQYYYRIYVSLSAYYRLLGNTTFALKYLDSSLVFKDSLAKIIDIHKKYGAELAEANARHKLNEQLAEKEEQKQILLRNSLIVFTLLTLVSVLLIYNRKLLKQKLRREQLLAEKQITETELAGARRQLEDFTQHITEKNELIETLKEKTTGSSDPEIIHQLQQSTLLTDEQWDNFRDLFEKAHPGYLYRLKEKMPGLTPAETRFMALCKLKLSNKEMSAMLGNSPDAIRQYRSRLRKKFNIPEEKNIEDLADTI